MELKFNRAALLKNRQSFELKAILIFKYATPMEIIQTALRFAVIIMCDYVRLFCEPIADAGRSIRSISPGIRLSGHRTDGKQGPADHEQQLSQYSIGGSPEEGI